MSISAKSAASTPPAPARIVTTASRALPFAGQEGPDFELVEVLLDLGQLGLGLGEGVGVALFGAHLDEDLEVLDARVHAGDAVVLGVGARQGGGDLLGLASGSSQRSGALACCSRSVICRPERPGR
jgi:hypothetical protein